MKRLEPAQKAYLVILFLAIASSAQANGAMGYALEVFDNDAWIVYVVLTVIFEAWMIGRWLGDSWFKSLAVSLGANFLTATCCLAFASPLHTQNLNPNPLLYTFELLAGFALISAVFESVVWNVTRSRSKTPADDTLVRKREWSVFWRSMAAHLWGVPLALVVLLALPHPYPGLDKLTAFNRWRLVSLHGFHPLDDWVAEHERLPTREEFRKFVTDLDENGWTFFYRPSFGRFDMREMKRIPLQLEWNPNAEGKRVDGLPATWLVRTKELDGFVEGLTWDGRRMASRYYSHEFQDNAKELGIQAH